jgi:hypothetical protein
MFPSLALMTPNTLHDRVAAILRSERPVSLIVRYTQLTAWARRVGASAQGRLSQQADAEPR